jgi:hypothetical protein
MRNSYTAVVELEQPFTGSFATEPYECGWASEALAFIRVSEKSLAAERLTVRVQVSPDGICWFDEGTTLDVIIGPGQAWARLSHFGGWLRLAGTFTGDQARGTLTFHLALKE